MRSANIHLVAYHGPYCSLGDKRLPVIVTVDREFSLPPLADHPHVVFGSPASVQDRGLAKSGGTGRRPADKDDSENYSAIFT